MSRIVKSVRVKSKGGTLRKKSVSSWVKQSAKWHARVPASVLLDKSISSDAVRVYGVLALSVYQGTSTARVGMRQIGTIIGKSAPTVKRRIDELEKAGHLMPLANKSGERGFYHLTSPVFGQKQGKKTEIIRGASGGPRFASVAIEDVA